ncbi:MAG: hypothetical protein PVF83_06530 [Anaerolineales bacterium]|jgi:hypothetical protein
MNEEKLDTLRNIEKYLKILVAIQLSPFLEEELKDKDNKKIYGMTGEKTVTEISEAVGLSTGKISGLWKRWESLGLLVKEGQSYKKFISN